MTKLEDMKFQNFDVVTFNGGTKAIYFDKRFYFVDGWTYTERDSIINNYIYNVKKILRPKYFKGDALRFLHNNHEDSHCLITIYDSMKKCPNCGQILEEN